MNLEIHFWEGQIPARIEHGDASLWASSESGNILRVNISFPGTKFNRSEKTYIMRCFGCDFYYFYEIDIGFVCGGWTDPSKKWASSIGMGAEFLLTYDNAISNSLILPGQYPLEINDERVKSGVLIPDDDARELGLL